MNAQAPRLPTGAHAAAAGRWLAHVAILLAEHPNQEVRICANASTASCHAQPDWDSGPTLTAHARLAHHQAFDATHAPALFGTGQGMLDVGIHLSGFESAPYLSGRVSRDQHGEASLQTSTGLDWTGIARAFGTLCEAVAGTDVFHRAFLWSLVAPGSGGATLKPYSYIDRLGKTLAEIQKVRPKPSTMAGLQTPYVPDPTQRALMHGWLINAEELAGGAAEQAFLSTLADAGATGAVKHLSPS